MHRVIPNEDVMSLRLTTLHENGRAGFGLDRNYRAEMEREKSEVLGRKMT